MPQPTQARIIEMIVPALNILWALHLDIAGHPGCPLRREAEIGINRLLRLVDEAEQ